MGDARAAAEGEVELTFKAIVRSTPWLMDALRAARVVDAPQWVIGAGAIRNAVWDRLHGFEAPTELADVDLAFFDRTDVRPEREQQVEAELAAALPALPWDAKNQAGVHLWYPRKFGIDVEPLRSIADGVATWPETATAVAVRLEADDELTVIAPFGVGDLVSLVHRRNPRRVTVEEFERRLYSKRISERWPRVRIVRDEPARP